MNIKPIETDEDYQAAMRKIERLFDAVPNTPEGDELSEWVHLVITYEDEHYPIPPPSRIEALRYYVESRGLGNILEAGWRRILAAEGRMR